MKKKYDAEEALKDIPIIEDTAEHFPNRDLTHEEKLLLLTKIIRYTSDDIANTLPPEDRVTSKLADSNIIQRFYKHSTKMNTEILFLDIGAKLRIYLTNNAHMLGIKGVIREEIFEKDEKVN